MKIHAIQNAPQVFQTSTAEVQPWKLQPCFCRTCEIQKNRKTYNNNKSLREKFYQKSYRNQVTSGKEKSLHHYTYALYIISPKKLRPPSCTEEKTQSAATKDRNPGNGFTAEESWTSFNPFADFARKQATGSTFLGAGVFHQLKVNDSSEEDFLLPSLCCKAGCPIYVFQRKGNYGRIDVEDTVTF